MTAGELVSLYPEADHAVAYTEVIICGVAAGEESAWDLLMRVLPPLPPREVVDYIRQTVEAVAPDEEVPDWRQAVAQMAHPQFLAYVRGKMGAY